MTFKRNTLTFKCNNLIIIVVVVRIYKRNSIWIGYNVPVTINRYYIITTLICAVQKNNDTSAFYTHFMSDFQDVSIPKKVFEMLLETEIKNTICTADQKESRLLRYLVG